MTRILFIEHDGTEHPVDVTPGAIPSVMDAAVSQGVPGIDADCGGFCSCATCHVFVREDWLDKLPPMARNEDAMLSLRPDRKANSRLACQLPLTEDLDGLVVTTPEFQY